MIIADENVETYWIKLLRSSNYEVYSIQENNAGISDLAVIEIIKKLKGVLLTEDKDFGKLVFAYSVKNVSIVFLRYDQPHYHTVENQLLTAIELYHDSVSPVFVTVTKNKTRVSRL